jgi:hypothetical protein
MSERNLGSPFFGLARAYLHSADLLLERLDAEHVGGAERDLPVRFLYSHAVELLLKAFLRMQGFSVETLASRQYGHDLTVLLEECNKLGLALSVSDRARLLTLLPYLEAGHEQYQFRYFEKSFNTADPHWMQAEVGILADAVGVEVEKQRQNAEEEAKAANMVLIPVPTKIIVSLDNRN